MDDMPPILDHYSSMLKTLYDKRMQADNTYESKTKVDGVHGIRCTGVHNQGLRTSHY
jgi:hypothetical protein